MLRLELRVAVNKKKLIMTKEMLFDKMLWPQLVLVISSLYCKSKLCSLIVFNKLVLSLYSQNSLHLVI